MRSYRHLLVFIGFFLKLLLLSGSMDGAGERKCKISGHNLMAGPFDKSANRRYFSKNTAIPIYFRILAGGRKFITALTVRRIITIFLLFSGVLEGGASPRGLKQIDTPLFWQYNQKSVYQAAEKAQSAVSSSKFVIAAYKVSTPHSSFFDSLHLHLFEQPECDI